MFGQESGLPNIAGKRALQVQQASWHRYQVWTMLLPHVLDTPPQTPHTTAAAACVAADSYALPRLLVHLVLPVVPQTMNSRGPIHGCRPKVQLATKRLVQEEEEEKGSAGCG